MITAREIDEYHVAAQEYLQQVQSEFMTALTGKRLDRNAQKAPQPIQENAPSPQVPMARNGENQLP